MLSKLILLGLQLVIAWFGAPHVMRYIPGLGALHIFVYAVVLAVIVWLVGLIAAQVLKEIGQPSSGTLVSAIVVALIGAALITWLPDVVPDLGRPMRQIPTLAYPLIGAVLGYQIRR
jgi:hypothetical protein